MFKRVLIPLEPTPQSEVLLERATLLKSTGMERLYLFTVVDVEEIAESYYGRHNQMIINSIVDGLEKRSREELQHLHWKYFRDDDSVSLRIRTGKAHEEIIKFAQNRDIDLIVLGARSEAFLTRLLGSITTRVLHHGPCPVLVEQFREGKQDEGRRLVSQDDLFEHVLYVTDFTASCWDVLESLEDMSGICSRVTIFHVQDWERIRNARERIEEFNTRDRRRMEQMAEFLRSAGIENVTTEVETGNPVELILEKARNTEASLLTMAARARSSLIGIRLGSTTHDVLRNTHLPVLVWPGAQE